MAFMCNNRLSLALLGRYLPRDKIPGEYLPFRSLPWLHEPLLGKMLQAQQKTEMEVPRQLARVRRSSRPWLGRIPRTEVRSTGKCGIGEPLHLPRAHR